MRLRGWLITLIIIFSTVVSAKVTCYKHDNHRGVYYDYDLDTGHFLLQVRKIKPDSIMSKVVPVYTYKQDVVGRFLKNFCDTIMKESRDDYLGYVIKNYWKHRLPKKKTLSDIEEDYRFNRPYIEPVTIDKTNMEKCKGVILADNGKIGILYDDEEEWIENMHVVRTNFYAEVEIVKIPELRPNPDVISVAMTDAYIPIVSILKVEADGKVDPEVIYYLSRPIQKSPDKAASFDWIEEYYKENGLAPGCTYYKQEKIYESNRNLGPIPLSILKPFSPIH